MLFPHNSPFPPPWPFSPLSKQFPAVWNKCVWVQQTDRQTDRQMLWSYAITHGAESEAISQSTDFLSLMSLKNVGLLRMRQYAHIRYFAVPHSSCLIITHVFFVKLCLIFECLWIQKILTENTLQLYVGLRPTRGNTSWGPSCQQPKLLAIWASYPKEKWKSEKV